MTEIFPLLTALLGAISGAIASYVMLRKDHREQRAQVVAEGAETIRLLKEQNDVLQSGIKAAETREAEAMERERRLEARIAEVEREYRRLVVTIAQLGIKVPGLDGAPESA